MGHPTSTSELPRVHGGCILPRFCPIRKTFPVKKTGGSPRGGPQNPLPTAWCLRVVWPQAWRALLSQLDEREKLDWTETFAKGHFALAKKGSVALATPNSEGYIARNYPPKMDASCAAIRDDGRSKAPLHGGITFNSGFSGVNIISRYIKFRS